MSNLPAVAAAIKKSQRLLLCGHVMPDGDSLGSVLALGLGLRWLGKDVTIVSSDPIPELYQFLPGIDTVLVGEVPQQPYDLLVAVDCSVPERLGKALEPVLKSNLPIAVIDHHVNDRPFGQYNYVRTAAAATGEIIMDLLDMLQVPISMELAVNLYTAIVTDTGSFRYENTTSDTHNRAARLLACGIPVARLSNQIFGEQPLASLKLLEVALGTLKVSPCGQIAWLSISQSQIKSVGACEQHIEGLINYPRKIKGVELAIVFRELDERLVKVSFRSKYRVNVNLLAGKFGGGGHVRAAGCTVSGSLDQVQAMVLHEAQELMRGDSGGRHS
ncbi:DHH family phosphoesterase [Desulforamulus hydrothermalis]|uniref:Phosphoesterase, RecJ domain protein n=1 Tax=Desulforamulus hydrothermalis Lam5 = DSM 18033 TaxID=1121428 RepID=K8E138_9FIRM|nr:bifunctional oligoribonuclease/PAP phosphatase NrnA [Desulforamulus hydrothermalis]CCO09422.1 Phosphoesterase, RecJ domain protein [Desulforamulus hydrothermalis Lam5 = DSM 18033]SHH08498.1 phosphoesterase RecJ domain-containing protein [Desulforamulus hydrothermalis Lam5 = DSM 18033]